MPMIHLNAFPTGSLFFYDSIRGIVVEKEDQLYNAPSLETGGPIVCPP